ncbi:MAG TPA: hypothetical protein VNT79_16025 [Phycisphaerae bacterium]|nr:hypothetical protein [Phycisphaerae bacterium]
MDSQLVELIGRNRLTADLLAVGLEVAIPERDRGIDLIAYVDLKASNRSFVARPIQLKAATSAYFQIDQKYERFSNLLIAYAWYVCDPERAVTFAMTHSQAVAIGEQMGYTRTASWSNGKYATTRPSRKLRSLMEPHRIIPGRWFDLVIGTSA